MDIYVGNIPKGTRPAELRKLLKDSVKKCLFRRVFNKVLSLGRLDNDVDVNILTHKGGKSDYRYGRVIIGSDRLAQVAFESIDGKALRGRPLKIRQYVRRDNTNDRRTISAQAKKWHKTERRQSERRKS